MKLISDGKPVKTKDGKYRLIEDWQLKYDSLGSILIVPKGYKCDLASIPKWAFWWGRGKWDIAAILHDYICEYGFYEFDWYKNDQWVTRKAEYCDRVKADRLFYEICLAVDVHPITALLMYWAVRIYSIFLQNGE